MGLFFWRNNKAIDAFAQTVADDLYSHVQPDVAQQHVNGQLPSSMKKRHKVEQKVAVIVGQIREFSESNALGIYGKARLQKRFCDRLRQLGYDESVTNRLLEIILLSKP